MNENDVTSLKETWTVQRISLLESEVQKLSAENSRLTSERDNAREDLEKAEQRLAQVEKDSADIVWAMKEESAELQQKYLAPTLKVSDIRCATCNQHEAVAKKDAELRALAKTTRRYRQERNELREKLEEFEATTEKLSTPVNAVDVESYMEIIHELEYRIGNWEDKYQKLDEKYRSLLHDSAYLVSQHTGAVWMLLNELDLVVDLDDALQRDLLYLINLLIRKDYRD